MSETDQERIECRCTLYDEDGGRWSVTGCPQHPPSTVLTADPPATSALAARHVNRENGLPWSAHSDDELWAILRARVLYEPIFKDKRGDITRYPSSGQCLDVMRVLRDCRLPPTQSQEVEGTKGPEE